MIDISKHRFTVLLPIILDGVRLLITIKLQPLEEVDLPLNSLIKTFQHQINTTMIPLHPPSYLCNQRPIYVLVNVGSNLFVVHIMSTAEHSSSHSAFCCVLPPLIFNRHFMTIIICMHLSLNIIINTEHRMYRSEPVQMGSELYQKSFFSFLLFQTSWCFHRCIWEYSNGRLRE